VIEFRPKCIIIPQPWMSNNSNASRISCSCSFVSPWQVKVLFLRRLVPFWQSYSSTKQTPKINAHMTWVSKRLEEPCLKRLEKLPDPIPCLIFFCRCFLERDCTMNHLHSKLYICAYLRLGFCSEHWREEERWQSSSSPEISCGKKL